MSQDVCSCELRPKGRPVYTDFNKGGSLVFGVELVKCPLCQAASELLAILRQMTDWAGGVDAQRLPPPWPEMVRTAKAAITKAEAKQ